MSNEGVEEKGGSIQSTNLINEEGISDCFKVVRTDMYVSLAPCHITNPINGIKVQHLDPLIMSYMHKGKGVVLSFSNITIRNDEADKDADGNYIAKVSDSSPFSFMWITVDFLLWSPQVGDILEGNVYMQTNSHLGLLVHDTFNASIIKRNIPRDWQFEPSKADEVVDEAEYSSRNSKFKSFGSWYDGNGNKVEGKLKFSVKFVYTAGKRLAVEGTLISPENEIEAQPVSTNSIATEHSTESNHITFPDEQFAEERSTEDAAPEIISQPAETALPTYGQNDSSDSDSDSD